MDSKKNSMRKLSYIFATIVALASMSCLVSCGPSKTELAIEHLRDSVRISDSLSVYILADEARRDSIRRLDSINQARLQRQHQDSIRKAQAAEAAAKDSTKTEDAEEPAAKAE